MTTMHNVFERTPGVSTNSRGPIVNLVAWIAMVTMCLSVMTVLVSKYIVLRKLSWHDLILTLAMLFSIGQTVATSDQVAAGLGRPLATLSAAGYIKFQKAGYAASLLYIASLACAKASTLTLLLGLTPRAGHRKPIMAVGGAIVLWAISALIASAFQCHLPHPWAYETGKCFSQIPFWHTIGAIDILIDVAIMALPILIVYHLQLALAQKVAVVSAFSFRLLAIGMTVFRLVTLPPSLRSNPSRTNAFATGSSDLTMTAYLPTIATLLATFTSIFVTCIPHLRPFMDSLQAGFLSGVTHDSVENRTADGNGGSYAMDKVGANSQVDPLATMRSQRSVAGVLKNANGQILVETPASSALALGTEKVVAAEMHRQQRNSSGSGSDGGGSRGSHGSDAMIIKQTKEWSVTYER